MTMLWSRERLLEAVENLRQFLGSESCEGFGMKLEQAVERAHLDEGDAAELLGARDVLMELVRSGRRPDEVVRVAVGEGEVRIDFGDPAVGALPFAE